MRAQVLQSRLTRQEGRSSAVASLPSGRSLSPWEQDLLLPTVVEVHGQEGLPARPYGPEAHHETKTFAQLQQMLIRNELVGAAAERARSRAENG
jgi:hypothetical protein